MFKKTGLIFGVVMMFALSSCASMVPKNIMWPAEPGHEVAQVQSARSYYENAFVCLKNQIVGLPKLPVGIVEILNQTGKQNHQGNDAAGSFLTLEASGMIVGPLFQLGIPMVDNTEIARKAIAWRITHQNQKLMTKGHWQSFKKDAQEFVTDWEPLRQNKLILPELLAIGALGSLDFGSNKVMQAHVFGFGAGMRTHSGRVAVDVRLVHNETGQIVAVSSFAKDIAGIEGKVDIGRFFGTILVDASAGAGARESFDIALRTVMQIVVYDLISQFYGIRACHEYTNGIFATGNAGNQEAPYLRFTGLSPEVSPLKTSVPVPTPATPVAPPIPPAPPVPVRVQEEPLRPPIQASAQPCDPCATQGKIREHEGRIGSLEGRMDTVEKATGEEALQNTGARTLVFVRFNEGTWCPTCMSRDDLKQISDFQNKGYILSDAISLTSPREQNPKALRDARAREIGKMFAIPSRAALDEELARLHRFPVWQQSGVIIRLAPPR